MGVSGSEKICAHQISASLGLGEKPVKGEGGETLGTVRLTVTGGGGASFLSTRGVAAVASMGPNTEAAPAQTSGETGVISCKPAKKMAVSRIGRKARLEPFKWGGQSFGLVGPPIKVGAVRKSEKVVFTILLPVEFK
jgi:hypothetical protein